MFDNPGQLQFIPGSKCVGEEDRNNFKWKIL